MTNTKFHIFIDSSIKLFVIIVLIVALTTKQQYSFYILLRWIIFVTFLIFTYDSYKKELIKLMIYYVFKISLSLFIFIILLTNISISNTINHHDKWYIHSKTEIKYYDNNEQLVTIPVCLRTLKSKLTIREVGEDDRWGGTMYGTLIYESKIWELVLYPDTPNESINYLHDLYLVEGELHNGKLYNTSLKNTDSEERLFIYYFLYGTSSNEMIEMYYFDIETFKLCPVNFKDYEGNISNYILIVGKGLDEYEIFPINNSDINKYKIKDTEFTICTKEFWVGSPNTLSTCFWSFQKVNFQFVEVIREIKDYDKNKIIKILK